MAVLLIVSVLASPLLFADWNGLEVVGFELPPSMTRKAAAAHMGGILASLTDAPAECFLAGCFEDGPLTFVAPVEYAPPLSRSIAKVYTRSRRSKAGWGWLSSADVRGTTLHTLATAAFASVASFATVISQSAWQVDGARLGRFRVGRVPVVSLLPAPSWIPSPISTQWDALRQGLREGTLLRDALFAITDADHEDLWAWAERISPPPLDEFPSVLLDASVDYASPALSGVLFAPVPTPLNTTWLPLHPPQRAAPLNRCPRSAFDLLQPAARRRAQRWLVRLHRDLLSIATDGPAAERFRPRPLAIGQEELWEWARGIVWDFTFERADCGIPLNFHLPISTHLNLDVIRERLHDYPDQRLLSFLLEGVRYEADVELQGVFVPHLLSLANGFQSVDKELRRLQGKGWYRFSSQLPFWPIYLNGQGSTPRKYEDRWRRTTEGGGPRQPTFDSAGLRALSLNEASQLGHVPVHHFTPSPEIAEWLANRGVPFDASLNSVPPRPHSRWPPELKPSVNDIARNLLVLKHAGALLEEPVYLFGDDAADYFNQLAMAPEDWWKSCTLFLSNGTDLPAGRAATHLFVSERRLGFGTHGASNVAQRFSDALLHLFRRDMDAAEDADEDPRPAMREWLRARRQLPKHGGRQDRLYFAAMYTDDPVFGVVGVRRAIRALRVWRKLTADLNLIMAIPKKRNLGVWLVWLGIIFFASAGLVVLPKIKCLRALEALLRTLRGQAIFAEYRSLVGLLEHFRAVAQRPRSDMHGLYEPHGPRGASRHGPEGAVRPNYFMRLQLLRHRDFVTTERGAHVTSFLRRAHFPIPRSELLLVASADAATDCQAPGLGGFCLGYFWRIALTPEHIFWLHITALELLATAINLLTFASVLNAKGVRGVVLSDALATPLTLSNHTEKSPMLISIHQMLLREPEYHEAVRNVDIGHLFGDGNVAADAVSRNEFDRLRLLCRALNLRPTELSVPRLGHDLLRRALKQAELLGRPAKNRTLSDVERSCGKRHRGNDAGDGPPSFLARLRADSPQPSASTTTSRAADTTRNSFLRRVHASKPWPTIIAPTPKAVRSARLEGLALHRLPRKLLERNPLLTHSYATADAAALDFTASRFGRSLEAAEARELARAVVEWQEHGHSSASRAKSRTAWRHWLDFASHLNFNPHLTAEEVASRPDRIRLLLSIFLLYVYPRLRGKQQRRAKPRSAFQHVLSLIRLFNSWLVPMPKAATIKPVVDGLLRQYADDFGKTASGASRKQPMLYSMLARMVLTRVGSHVAGAVWDPASGKEQMACLDAMALLWRTGHRLSEVIRDEGFGLTRGDVSWRLGGVLYTDPTPEQLQTARRGDLAIVAPSRSKTDQFGEVYCPFPSALAFEPGNAANAAYRLQQLELRRPCRGDARATTPLISVEGRPVRRAALDRWLRGLLIFHFGPAIAGRYSWHSFRIGLACALHAAGCPDEIIQIICRWATPESLKVYRRLGFAEGAAWTSKAEKATVDNVQTAHLVELDNTVAFAELHRTLGGWKPFAETPSRPLLPPPTPLPSASSLVLVPRHLWPDSPCDENGGRGWSARILSRTSAAVHVEYTSARHDSGAPLRSWLAPDVLQEADAAREAAHT